LYSNSGVDGCGNERGIERLPRERGRGKGQWSLCRTSGGGESNIVDRYRSKRSNVDSERLQILKGFTA